MNDVQLSECDRELFGFLYSNKVALFRQIRTEFFPKVKRDTLYKRLQRLEKAGLLRVISLLDTKWRSNIYGLTDKSFKMTVDLQDNKGMRKQFKSDSVMHDVDLVDIQGVIKWCEFVTDYITENELKSGATYITRLPLNHFVELNTDAVAAVEFNNKKYNIGIEYEASFKHRKRSVEKLMRYYTNPEVSNVVFICKTDQLLKDYMHLDKKYFDGYRHKVFYSTLRNVLNPKDKMTFYNVSGDSLCFGKVQNSHFQ